MIVLACHWYQPEKWYKMKQWHLLMEQFVRYDRKMIDVLTLSTGCEETSVDIMWKTSTVCPLTEMSTEVNVLLLIPARQSSSPCSFNQQINASC